MKPSYDPATVRPTARVPRHNDYTESAKFEGEHGPCMVTDMVNVGKLIWELMSNFPHPVPTWVRKPVLQINGLLAAVSVSGHY